MIRRGLPALLLAMCGFAAVHAQEQRAAELRLAAGERVRYSVNFQLTTQTKRSGLVEDPQAPGRIELEVEATLAIEALAFSADRSEARFRATFEKCRASVYGDVFLPSEAAIEQQYRNLEGESFEFIRGADGKVRTGGEFLKLAGDARTAAGVREWLEELFAGAHLPAGTKPGEKWSAQEPLGEAPLAGMIRRTESEYLRNGPCRRAEPSAAATSPRRPEAEEKCAVVLTRATLARATSAPSDPTPADYRARGLRTAGSWTGHGEILQYVSHASHLLVSSAYEWEEQLELTVSSDGPRYQQSSRVKARRQIALLSPGGSHEVRK